jgi:hypothetical protein
VCRGNVNFPQQRALNRRKTAPGSNCARNARALSSPSRDWGLIARDLGAAIRIGLRTHLPQFTCPALCLHVIYDSFRSLEMPS